MSGLNRLPVPDLGEQAHLQPLYQRRQRNAAAWRDGCQRGSGMARRKEERHGEEMEGEKGRWKAAMKGWRGSAD